MKEKNGNRSRGGQLTKFCLERKIERFSLQRTWTQEREREKKCTDIIIVQVVKKNFIMVVFGLIC